jgi:hypothetical protein
VLLDLAPYANRLAIHVQSSGDGGDTEPLPVQFQNRHHFFLLDHRHPRTDLKGDMVGE